MFVLFLTLHSFYSEQGLLHVHMQWDAEFFGGMSQSGGLDIKNVACQDETDLDGWNLGLAQPEVPPPYFTGKRFGLSVAATWRGSLVATGGMDQNRNHYIALHRSAGSHWVTEFNSVMRSGYTNEPSSRYREVWFGWDVQMADVMPNVVANKNSRLPVHVLARGVRRDTSSNRTASVHHLYLDAFYCIFALDFCVRPRLLFDRRFYYGRLAVRVFDDFLPPPPIDNATLVYEADEDLFTTFVYPFAFSLSRDCRYLTLAYLNSFTIHEWQPHIASGLFSGERTGIEDWGGIWGPSFGTKQLGLNDDNLFASILYTASSNGMGNDNQEIVIALGLVRHNFTAPSDLPQGTTVHDPRNVVRGPLHVVVYRWTKGMEPTPIGKPIKSHEHWVRRLIGNSMLPKDSVQISTNGRVLSILSSFRTDDEEGGIFADSNNDSNTTTIPKLKVYEWDDENDDWKRRQTFSFDGSVLNTMSHSLSWDGSVVAIAESYEAGRMYIYRWNADVGQYIQQYREEKPVKELAVLDSTHRTVSLAGDGSTLFVGSPFGGTTIGNVLTYRDDYATACRGNDTHPQLLHIALQPRGLWGVEWSVIKRSTNTTIRRNGPHLKYDENRDLYFHFAGEWFNNIASFTYQECLAVMECSTMGLTVDTSSVPASLWQLQDQYLAIFNGKNLTRGEFNNDVISVQDADCELVIELLLFNDTNV